MLNNKERNIHLETDTCSCCPPENNSAIKQSPILLQTEVPAASGCSCCEPSEEQPACGCCEPNEVSNKNHLKPELKVAPPKIKTQPLQFNMQPSSGCSCCSDEEAVADDRKSNDIQPLTGDVKEYQVTGMDCPVCAQTIEKSLIKLSGITSVRVNYSTSKMQVSAAENVTEESILKHVQKLGFTAAPLYQTKKKAQTYLIEGMDCGVCAQTLEKYLRTLPAVQEATVNFSTGKMQIVHDMTSEEVLKAVTKSGFKATLLAKSKEKTETPATVPPKFKVSPSLVSGVFLLLGYLVSQLPVVPEFVSIGFYMVSLLSGGYKPAKSAYYGLKSKSLDMNVL